MGPEMFEDGLMFWRGFEAGLGRMRLERKGAGCGVWRGDM